MGFLIGVIHCKEKKNASGLNCKQLLQNDILTITDAIPELLFRI